MPAPDLPKVDLKPAEVEAIDFSYQLGQISIGNIATVLGSVLVGTGFVTFFQTGDAASAIELTYGVPVLLIGFALKYAELPPVYFLKESELPERVKELRKQQCTPVLAQLRKDVTRFRFGDEKHLDDALPIIGVAVRGYEAPKLVAVREEERDGRYALVLQFLSSEVGIQQFTKCLSNFEGFFGPCVKAEVSDRWTKDVPGLVIDDGTGANGGEVKFAYAMKNKVEYDKIEVALISTLGQ
eukprot:CAMPEP_0184656958 /NCGR_PEP_ID=MMETSP0308-20130426/16870_1 /TAXON_ID=38269 /ORGANISM="Gloeochaete witrockiana, Strain SAG 46.84" /LENGTH=239 /DNA_ID=CAMNT_0027094299 /DNA_START=305 /DNA_END=1024 /DNA_ORIENTATION=+